MVDRGRMALAVGMLAVACRPTTSIGSTAGDTSSTTATVTTTTDETTSATTPTSDATTQVGMDGSASDSSTSTDVDDSGHDSRDHDTDGDAMCMPAQFDSQCIACSKVHCCPEFAACADDFECGCMLGCLQYPGFPGPCMCAPTQQGAELFGCLATACDFVCP